MARQQLRDKLARATIDQLAHEKDQAQIALSTLKLCFSREELQAQNQSKYALLCSAHKDIFSGHNGKLTQLRELNERTHRAMEELQATMSGKNVDLGQIANDFHR